VWRTGAARYHLATRVRTWSLVLLGLLLTPIAGLRCVFAQEVVETADDGTVLVRYQVDEQGRKQGPFERFHPNGKPAVRATYEADLLQGPERRWDAEGTLRSIVSRCADTWTTRTRRTSTG